MWVCLSCSCISATTNLKSYNCIFVHDLPCAIGSLVGLLVGAAVGDLDGLLEGGLLGLLEGLGVGLPMASINESQ